MDRMKANREKAALGKPVEGLIKTFGRNEK
jgi:hypothetical protein